MSKPTKMLTVVRKVPGQAAEQTEIPQGLEALQAAVNGYVECIQDPQLPGVDIWLNEEGKLNQLPPNVWLFAGQDVGVGTLVFARSSAAGNTISLRPVDIRRVVAWCASKHIQMA